MKNTQHIAFAFCVAVLGVTACRADAILVSTSSNVSATGQSNSWVNFIDSPDPRYGSGPNDTYYKATIVSENLNGLPSYLTFDSGGRADYQYAGTGDRLVLLITNTTGHSLNGIDFSVSGNAYITSGIYPNVGTWTPGQPPTYTIAQPFGSGVTVTDNRELDVLFQTPLGLNASTAIFIPVDVSKCTSFTLSQVAAPVPEPTTLGLGALGLGAFGWLRRKFARRG